MRASQQQFRVSSSCRLQLNGEEEKNALYLLVIVLFLFIKARARQKRTKKLEK